MKSILTALVLSAASILPVQAGIHDFNPTNAAPTRTKAQVGSGNCITTRERSKACYIKVSTTNFAISILDVDFPGKQEVAYIDCSTGRWNAFGDLPKATLDLYLRSFCPTFG